MAISKEQLSVEVVLDSSGAIKGIKDLQGQFVELDKIVKSSSSTSDKANTSTGKLGAAFEGMSATLSKAALPMLAIQTAVAAVTQVFGVLSNTLGSFVDDYAAAEKAQIMLTQAIENSGGRIQNTADAWGEYLDSLQEVKAVDADVLRGLVAQAVQMGFSESQIKSLVEATIGLSKVTGDSLDGSFQRLIGTTRGMARGLSAMIPELQNLTDEQLRSGDAFALVADKYKKAADGAGSYTDSVKRAKLAAGELSEDIGKLIVETFNLNAVIDTARDVINRVRNAIAAVDMKALSESFKEFMTVAGPIAGVIGAVTLAVTGLGASMAAAVAPVLLITAKITLIVAAVAGVIAIIEILIRNFGLFDEALAMIASSIAFLFLKPLENAAWSLKEFLGLFGDNALTKAADQVFKGIEKSVNSLKDNVSKNFTKIKDNIDTGFSGQVVKQGINLVKGFTGETDKAKVSLENLGKTGARIKVIDEKAIEAAKNALKDIQKETANLKLQTAQMGEDEITQIKAKTSFQLEAIKNKQKELQDQGILNDKLKEALKAQEDAVKVYGDKAIKAAEEKAILESQKGPLSELKKLNEDSAKWVEQTRLSNLGTFDVINEQAQIELEKISALEEQLKLTGALNEENQQALENAKNTVEEMRSAKTGKAIMEGVNSAISAAQGGADALVGNMISQIGKAFGPEGEMIAGVINLLRKGKDFTKQLGQDLMKIIADLPKMITEGAVGLIEGLIDGFLEFLGNPKAIEEFIYNLQMMMPRIITALIEALPALLVAFTGPKFVIGVVKGFVKAFIDGIPMMLRGLRDAIKQIGDDFGKGLKKAGDDFGAGIKKIGDFFGQIFGKFGKWLDEGLFQPLKQWFSDNWISLVLAPFTLGLSLFFDNEQIKDFGKRLWTGITDALSGLWQWFADLFSGVGSFFKNLFKFDGGGKGAVEDFLGFDFPWIAFADGGFVPGKPKVLGDSSKNDTVPALLSPGEAVIPRSMMKDKSVAAFVNSLFSGKKPEGHFLGIPGTEAVPWGDEEVKAVGDWIGDTLVPDNIKKLWDSITRFISNIDLKRLVTDPLGMITDAIKGSLGFLVEPFKQMMKFSTGGIVPGSGTGDSVPAMLTPGEFVINRNAAQSLGAGLLNRLNSGSLPTDSAPIFNINLNIETRDALDASFIRNTLVPTIKSELKASSLRGDFVLSAKGVRS